MDPRLSINTHYLRPATVKKCKLGYKYKKSRKICKRFI